MVARIHQKITCGRLLLAMEGMTTKDKAEKERILDLLVATDAGTHLMHEGFDVDNPEIIQENGFHGLI